MFHVCLCYAFLYIPYGLVVACLERTDLLAHLCVVCCVFLTLFYMVFLVRCCTGLYQLLIFAFLFTMHIKKLFRDNFRPTHVSDTTPVKVKHSMNGHCSMPTVTDWDIAFNTSRKIKCSCMSWFINLCQRCYSLFCIKC